MEEKLNIFKSFIRAMRHFAGCEPELLTLGVYLVFGIVGSRQKKKSF